MRGFPDRISLIAPTPPELVLTAARAGELTVLVVSGELDLASAGHFAATVSEHLAGERPVLLDLTAVPFMDSAGVRALDGLLREAGTLLVGRDLQRGVRQILELTGLMSVLPLADLPGAGGG